MICRRSTRLLILCAFFLNVVVVAAPSTTANLLNSRENSVLIPSGFSDYAIVQDGSRLFVAWVEHSAGQASVVLVEVDLLSLKVRERYRSNPEPSVVLSPTLALAEGRPNLAWLSRGTRGSRGSYRLELAALEAGEVKRESRDYGTQMGHIRLQETPRGLFVVGANRMRDERSKKLRLLRKYAGSWEPVTISQSAGSYDQEPVLGFCGGRLHLVWIRDGRVCTASSMDGRDWGEVLQLSAGGSSSPCVFPGTEDELVLVWSESRGSGSRIWLASWHETAGSWKTAMVSPDIGGNRLQFEIAVTRDNTRFLLYHYWNILQQCENINFAIMSAEWNQTRLDQVSNTLCGRSLTPFALLNEDVLYVVWQERRGRKTAIRMNRADFPWDRWMSVPNEILSSDKPEAYAAPKLVVANEQVFLLYFVYRTPRGPFEKNLQLGNLVLRDLNASAELVETGMKERSCLETPILGSVGLSVGPAAPK